MSLCFTLRPTEWCIAYSRVDGDRDIAKMSDSRRLDDASASLASVMTVCLSRTHTGTCAIVIACLTSSSSDVTADVNES